MVKNKRRLYKYEGRVKRYDVQKGNDWLNLMAEALYPVACLVPRISYLVLCALYLYSFMFRQPLNWRTLLALIAIFIVSGTVWYSSYLANKIEKEERQKVELWVQAGISISDLAITDTRLPLMVTQQNDIPIIATNERDSIM